MGTYITAQSDVYGYIPASDLAKLLDDDTDGSVDTSIFTTIVADVEALFESCVMRRYAVPLDTTDARTLAVAKQYCARLLEYALFSRRRAVTDEIGKRYQQVLSELKDIRDGHVGLTDPPPTEASSVYAASSATSADRNFTSITMEGWGGGSTRDS